MKSCLSSGFRDALLTQLKNNLKAATSFALDAAEDHSPSKSASSSSQTAQRNPPPPPPDSSPGSKSKGTFQQRLQALEHEQFLVFWRNILRFITYDLGRKLKAFLFLIQAVTLEQVDEIEAKGVDAEVTRCWEVSLGTLIQKAGSLITYRQQEHQTLLYTDWQRVLELTAVEMRDLVEKVQSPLLQHAMEKRQIDVAAPLRAIP